MNNVQHQQQQRQTGSHGHHHHHLDDEEEDDVAGSGGAGGGAEESVDNPHPHHHSHSHSQIQYDANPHSHALHNGGDSATAMDSAVNGVEGVGQHALYVPGSEIVPAPAGGGGADQLTLSFQGEVYVFDSVSPEKVIFNTTGAWNLHIWMLILFNFVKLCALIVG